MQPGSSPCGHEERYGPGYQGYRYDELYDEPRSAEDHCRNRRAGDKEDTEDKQDYAEEDLQKSDHASSIYHPGRRKSMDHLSTWCPALIRPMSGCCSPPRPGLVVMNPVSRQNGSEVQISVNDVLTYLVRSTSAVIRISLV